MKFIQHKGVRINNFSKRKARIFKKASGLCTFPGTEVGVIFFSPTGKPYSFAHPNIESVINRFLDQNPSQNYLTTNFGEADDICELNKKYDEVLKQLEAEEEKGKLLDQMEKERISKGGLMAPIEELSLQELEELSIKMKQLQIQLQKHICNQLEEERNEAASSSAIGTTNPSHAIDPFTDGKTK